MIRLMTAVALVGLSLPACGGDGGGGNDGGGGGGADAAQCPNTGRLIPLETGASWRFRVTDLGTNAIETKIQTVGALEDVGGAKAGTMAYRVTTQKQGGTVISWQEDTGDRILRHREQDGAGGTQTDEVYDAYKLRVDESPAHTADNATWTEVYSEIVTDTSTNMTTTTSKTEDWTVEAVDELVTVPAGTFCAVRIHRISMATVGGSDKMYWFAPGVGKLRELTVDRVEELTEVTLP